MSYRTSGFPEYGMTNASNFSEALPLTATPKWVIQQRATTFTLIFLKVPRLKKTVS